MSQAKSQSSREQSNPSIDNFSAIPEHLRQSKNQVMEQELRKSQIHYNNEIRLLSKQIENLDLGLDGTGKEENPMSQTAKSRYYNIQLKKADLNLFDEDMNTKLSLATDGLKQSKRGTQSSNVNITQEPPILSQVQKNIAKVQSQIMRLDNKVNLLESKIMNKIRLRDSSTQTEFQVLRLILTKERVEKLQKLLEVLKVCDGSLQDGVKLSHLLGVDQNLDPTLSQYNDFVNSEFNTGRLKAKFLFNRLFKSIIQSNFLTSNGGFEEMTLTQAKRRLYNDKVKAYLARIKSDLELQRKF